jgi:hypothetical protein
LLFLRAATRHLLGQPLHEGVAVEQVRQRVVVRQVLDVRTLRQRGAQVAHDHHAQRLAAALGHADDELDGDARAVAMHQRALVRQLRALGHHLHRPRHLVGRDEVQRLAAQHLRQAVADQALQRQVGVDDDAVLEEDDAFDAGVHELRQPLFRLAQRQFGLAPRRDVVDEHEGAVERAVGGQVRQQLHVEPARALRRVELALVARAALLRAQHGDVRLDDEHRLGADDGFERAAEDRLFVEAERTRITRVGEQAAEGVGVVERHQRRHAVGHQAQQAGVLLHERLRGGKRWQGLLIHVGNSSTEAARHRSSHARALSASVRSR